MRAQDGHFVQTVKKADPSGPAGTIRGEWEDAVSGADPDPLAPITGRFLAPDIALRLTSLFRTEIARQTIALAPSPDTRIEAAIDRGRVYASACPPNQPISEPISEVELELKSGSPATLYDVALDLLAVAPVRLEHRSKAERGYRLLASAAATPAAVHAAAVRLDPELSGDEALRLIGLACLDQLLRNEPAVLAGVAEGVHQMRVAVRRLRAILSAFAELLPDEQWRWASEELRWLADALSAARNLDVFEQAVLAPARRALAATAGFTALAEGVERRRAAAYAAAKRAIRSRRYTALLLRLLRWFERCGWRDATAPTDLRQPIAVVAAQVLERRRRAAKRRGESFARQSASQRHRLRIALKKLRYATELLAGLYAADKVAAFTKLLKRLQDDLGAANDVRVARDIVAELAKGEPGDGAIAAAGEAMLDWHHRRLAGQGAKTHKALRLLFDAAPFWAA